MTDTISVTIPGAAQHIALLRTAIGGIAARERFTLDQVDDLRLAVEEAAAQLLAHAPPSISMHINSVRDGLEIRLVAGVGAPVTVDRTGFSWVILEKLADKATVEQSDGQLAIALHKSRPDLASA